MKNFKHTGLLALFCLLLNGVVAQKNSIVFSYDKAGNVAERRIQVMAEARMAKFPSEKDSTLAFKVYPNPTNNFLNIEGLLPEGKTSAQIVMMNVNGQLLKQDTYTGSAKTIPVSDLAPGLYVLEIRYSKEEKSVYKIVVGN